VAWCAPKGFWPYVMLQIPDVLLFGLVLLLLYWWLGLSLGWVLGLVLLWVVVELGLFFLMHDVFLPARAGPGDPVGARAVAKEPLAPVGHVVLFGETWRAENLKRDEPILPGAVVVVRGRRGLTLLVDGEGAAVAREREAGP
jgi:NfeD-like C-terminal, partner-binding